MANNRLRLKCIQCAGSSRWFAKELGEGWYVSPALEEDLLGVLDEFFNQHDVCTAGSVPRPFVVEYENDS